MAGGGHTIHTFDVPKIKPVPTKYLLDVSKRWAPSAMTFGACAGVMFLYFTDWKLFMDKVPFYRKKFEPKEVLT